MNQPVTFKFLGTAAAEGIPGLFCQCEICRYAAEAGGKNIRGRSGAMIGDKIMIDFPPDMLANKIRFGLDLAEITDIFVTHSHADHLAAAELGYRYKWFAIRNKPDTALTVHGNAAVLETVRNAIKDDMDEIPGTVILKEIVPFRPETAHGITFTPLLAKHNPKEACVFYLIEREGRRMIFANDTTFFPDETFAYLAGKRLDIVSLDCTTGKYSSNGTHMGFPNNLEVKEKLLAQGSADKDTMFISHHFSHNGHVNYDDFAALAEGSGFISSWDGMEAAL